MRKIIIAVIDSEFGQDVLVSEDWGLLINSTCSVVSSSHGVHVGDIEEIRKEECRNFFSVDFYEFIPGRDGNEAVRLDI